LEFGSFQKRNKGTRQVSREHNGNGSRGNVKSLPPACTERSERVRPRRAKGTRKIKSRAKTGQHQDELPEWVHRGRGDINEGKHGCARLGHPPGRIRTFGTCVNTFHPIINRAQ
jgi:hypothetical protein